MEGVQHQHLRSNDPDQPVILIAEDEVSIQDVVRIILEEEGFFVLTAENGEAALSVSRQYPGEIHLLLTDIVMPQMGGVELSNRISSERPGICIVLMSGNSFAETINPEVPFLEKPFSPKQLKATIAALIPVCHGAQN